MANFYADEQFPRKATIALRLLGHDVLTVQEAGNGNQKIPDEDVLAFAIEQFSLSIVVTLSAFTNNLPTMLV